MAIQAGNLAPMTIVVAITGYLCWSYWDDTPAGAPAEAKLPEIEAKLLHPSLGAAADRDPFGTTVAFQLDVDETNGTAPGKGNFQSGKANKGNAKPGQTGTQAGTGPGKANQATAVQKISGKEATNLLAGFILNATYIQANHRVALINGRTYARGEPLDTVDPKTGPFLLSEIHRHKVVLDYDGKKVDLGYPDTSQKPDKTRLQQAGKRQPGKTSQPSAGSRRGAASPQAAGGGRPGQAPGAGS